MYCCEFHGKRALDAFASQWIKISSDQNGIHYVNDYIVVIRNISALLIRSFLLVFFFWCLGISAMYINGRYVESILHISALVIPFVLVAFSFDANYISFCVDGNYIPSCFPPGASKEKTSKTQFLIVVGRSIQFRGNTLGIATNPFILTHQACVK